MKVVGYVRVSTEGQADAGVSLEAQKTAIETYCGLYDLELVTIITDAGASAKTLDREGLQQALEMLSSGQVEGLVVHKLDRLTRSVRDLDTLINGYFSTYTLHSVSEKIDTSSASGRLILNVLASVSQWEREAIGERTKTALTHKKQKGEHCGGVGYGMKIEDKKLVKDESEYPIVERVATLKRNGYTLQAIADYLNDAGIPTQRGGVWQPTQVSRLLSRHKSMELEALQQTA